MNQQMIADLTALTVVGTAAAADGLGAPTVEAKKADKVVAVCHIQKKQSD